MSFTPSESATEEITRYLNCLAATADEKLLIAITMIHFGEVKSDARLKFRTTSIKEWREKPQELISFVQLWVGMGYNAYAMPTLFHTKPNEHKRGDKSLIAGGSLLWVDIDLTPEEQKDFAGWLKKFQALALPPTMIVFTGRGYHLYWKLSEFVEDYRELEKRTRFLRTSLRGDHCHDASHILRLPGTLNFKKEFAVPPNVAIVDYDVSRVYDIHEFAIEELPTGNFDELTVMEEPLPENFLTTLPDELRTRIVDGPVGTSDRSANDWFVAKKLIESGHTPGQVYSVFCHPTWAVGEKGQTNNAYVIRTIQKAVTEYASQAVINAEAILQPLIEKHMITRDKNNKPHIDIPAQSLPMIKDMCTFLQSKGFTFLYDKHERAPYLITPTGEIIRATGNSREFTAWLCSATMFTPDAKAFRTLLTGIIAFAMNIALVGETHPWSFLNSSNNEWRVLLDHATARQVIRCTPGFPIALEVNGTNGVMLMPSPRTPGQVIDWNDGELDWRNHVVELITLTLNNFPTTELTKQFLTCYMLGLPIVAGLIAQGMLPMLHVTGRPGAGKTGILKTISAFIHGGTDLESGSTGAAVNIIAQKDFFLPFDDYESLPEFLQEFILTNATGAVRHKVGNVEENSIVHQRAHTMLAMTSVSDIELSTLRRRTIQITADSAKFGRSDYDDAFKDKIITNRGIYWNAYIRFISEAFLSHINTASIVNTSRAIASSLKVQEYKPMAPFLAVIFEIGRALSKFDMRFDNFSTIDIVAELIKEFNFAEGDVFIGHSPLYEPMQQLVINASKHNDRTPTGNYTSTRARVIKGLGDNLYVEESLGFVPHPEIKDPENWQVMSGLPSSYALRLVNLGFRQIFANNPNLGQVFSKHVKEVLGTNNLQLLMANGTMVNGYAFSPLHKFGTSGIFVQYAQHTDRNRPALWRFWYRNPPKTPVNAETAQIEHKNNTKQMEINITRQMMKLEKDPLVKLALARRLAMIAKPEEVESE